MVLTKQDKKQRVSDIKKMLADNQCVAVASIAGLKSRQFNAIKKKLRGQAEIIVARKSLLLRAMDEAKPELKPLQANLTGAEVLILSNLDAFKLFRLLKQNKTKTGAKPGAIAPMDIVVQAGETNLPPGPVLTELKQAKIDAKIQGPKIVINKDATVAKKGEPIAANVAAILSKLGIEPIEVGIAVHSVFDKGDIYPGATLDVDEAALFAQFTLAHQQAVNLSVSAEIFNKYSTELLIMKAAREANAISSLVKLEPASGANAPAETPAEAQSPPAQ